MSVTHSNPRSWAGRRCLVTGASGFLGSTLCARLRSGGAVVHAVQRHDPPAAALASQKCDVSDLDQVRAAFAASQPDCVFHLAAKVAGEQSLELVGPTLSTNLVGTVNVLLTAMDSRCSNVVTIGSPMEPDQQLRGVPCSPYAVAKFAASAYARMFAGLFSLPVAIARPFMVYGAGQLDFTKLVPYVSRQLISGGIADLSTGRQAFDWVYVDDVVEALMVIASRHDLSGLTIDIGSGELNTVAEVARGVARRLNRPEAIRLGALPDRQLEPTRAVDVDATAELIGWRPKFSLQEGLDRTVAWYRTYLGREAATTSH